MFDEAQQLAMASPTTTRHTPRLPSLTMPARADGFQAGEACSPVTPVRAYPSSPAPIVSSEDITAAASTSAAAQEPALYRSLTSSRADYLLPSPHYRKTVGKTVGNWQIGKTIGQGSMGRVKLARNSLTGEQVR
jgi:serine/threonine protein kinase KIN1/2